MNRKWLTGIGVSLLVAASLIAVGAIAYRAGERDELGAARDFVGDETARTVIVSDGWRHGWPGFGFGFLFFPLLIVGLILLFRRGRWFGPWRNRDDELREWHRRAHAQDAALAQAPTAPAAPATPPPPPAGDVPPERPAGA